MIWEFDALGEGASMMRLIISATALATASATVAGPIDCQFAEQAKLVASDGASHDAFGWSVSISDDTAVIGAWGDADNGSDSGSAYVYERQGDGSWLETAKLTAADGASGDWFGYSVAIAVDVAVIGARRDDHNSGSDSGSAYGYARCECNGDIAGPDGPGVPDGVVGIDDLLAVVAYWGSSGPEGDVGGDGFVDADDLLAVLAAWGPCPCAAWGPCS